MDEKILNGFVQLFSTRGDGKSLNRSLEFAKFLFLLGAIQVPEEYKRKVSQLEPTLERDEEYED